MIKKISLNEPFEILFYRKKNGGDLDTCPYLLQNSIIFKTPLNQTLNPKRLYTLMLMLLETMNFFIPYPWIS